MNFRIYIVAATEKTKKERMGVRPPAEKPDGNKEETAFFQELKKGIERSTLEKKQILENFHVSKGPVGKTSAYGQVFDGVWKGKRVAIKIEPRESDSNEASILAKIKHLRQQAPEEIKIHLPIIYEIGNGSYWQYYVMENLNEAPKEVIQDIYGSTYSLKENKFSPQEFDFNPSLVNKTPTDLMLDMGEKRWGDSSLYEAAFRAWFFTSPFSQFNDDERVSFQNKIKHLIFVSLQKTHESTPPHGPRKMTSAAEAAKKIYADVKKELTTTKEIEEWDEISTAVPELLFVIAKTGFIPIFHPDHPNVGDVISDYDTLHQAPQETYHQNLRNTLEWLSQHGLKWGDVHGGNIMIRPGTNDIVFIDFGLYAEAAMKFQLFK